jgi:uncharacterized protein YbjQ (UPF0145 family)
MDNPFSSEGQNPFQKPYEAPSTPVNPGSGIKPFAAVDLAPSAGQRPNQGMASSPSPFLQGGLSNAFLGRPDPSANGLAQAKPGGSPFVDNKAAPMAKPPVDYSPVAPAAPAQFEAPVAHASQAPYAAPAPYVAPAPYAAAPSPYPTAPQASAAPMAAARQSHIMALKDVNSPFKPEFFLTSTASVESFTIQEYLGLVSVEVVVPKDLLFRNPAPHGELHRLKSAEDQLQRVKETALEELSGRAKSLGADGIVGVTLQFSQFDTIVCLCSAVGTAVKLSE